MSPRQAMPALIASTAFAVVAVAITLSADLPPHPAHATMDTIAASMDTDSDGAVVPAEHRDFTVAAIASMDHDGDGTVDASEFLGWDMGLSQLAAAIGRDAAYTSMKTRVFSVWDADGNGVIAPSEAHAQAATEFARADADRDGRVVASDLAHGSESLGRLMTVATA